MRSYTRHQLKQDSFRTSTTETISWAVEHQSKLIAAAMVVAWSQPPSLAVGGM